MRTNSSGRASAGTRKTKDFPEGPDCPRAACNTEGRATGTARPSGVPLHGRRSRSRRRVGYRPRMSALLPVLILAAVLEVAGDAAIRHGLGRGGWGWMIAGGASLVVYGIMVNTNRSLDFGRVMGIYIAVFFLVSQLIAAWTFGDRPAPSLIVGGALIVAGGLVIQAGVR